MRDLWTRTTLALLLLPTAVAAQVVEQPRWIIRGFGAQVQTGGAEDFVDASTPGQVDHTKVRVDNGTGFGLAAEYRMTCRLGLEGGYIFAPLDAHFLYDANNEWLRGDDDLDTDLITLGLNIHLTPEARADLYVGPLVAWANYGNPEFNVGGSLGTVEGSFDDEFGFGAQLGLDLPFRAGGNWALNGAVRYLALGADGTVRQPMDLDLDPLIASLGLAYRFGHDRGPTCGEPLPPPPPPAPAPPPPAPEPEPEPAPPPPPPAPEPPKEIRETCHFAPGSARVDNICQAKLDEVALQMEQDPEFSAQVIGYTDATGSTTSNQAISERRAEAVKSFLVERHGIDPARITTEGRGSADPVASNDTAAGRGENRRVVIILTTAG